MSGINLFAGMTPISLSDLAAADGFLRQSAFDEPIGEMSPASPFDPEAVPGTPPDSENPQYLLNLNSFSEVKAYAEKMLDKVQVLRRGEAHALDKVAGLEEAVNKHQKRQKVLGDELDKAQRGTRQALPRGGTVLTATRAFDSRRLQRSGGICSCTTTTGSLTTCRSSSTLPT